MKTRPGPRLIDLPLWRLLVCLADAERQYGPAAPVTRELADVVRQKLTDDRLSKSAPPVGHREGVPSGR